MTLPHSLNILDYPARYQFNQPGVPLALARTACSDTCVQMIIEYYKERTVPLTDIRKASGIGIDGVHGLTIAGAIRALRTYGVSYSWATGVNAEAVDAKSKLGPVIIGVGYRLYPKWWEGTGTPKAERGGKVDYGFNGAHAVLFIKRWNHYKLDAKGQQTTTVLHQDWVLRDPDHYGTALPNLDRFNLPMLDPALKALVSDTPWDTTFCIYPTRAKVLIPTLEDELLLEAENTEEPPDFPMTSDSLPSGE